AEAREDLDDVVERLTHRMPVAALARAAGQRDVELFAVEMFFPSLHSKSASFHVDQPINFSNRLGYELADARSILRGRLTKCLAKSGKRSAFPQRPDSNLIELLFVLRGVNLLSRLGDKLVDLLDHVRSLKRQEPRRFARRGPWMNFGGL